MKFTAEQIAQILETPLGRTYHITDPVVLAERAKITKAYENPKRRFFKPEELCPGIRERHPDGAVLIPSFEECSLRARADWIRENLGVG